MSTVIRKRDIAIIGLSCKFPKSNNVEVFWNNLVKGQEMVSFFSKEELNEYATESENVNSQTFVGAKSYIENAGNFDYPFFGYTKDEANCMDPQIRMLHEQVWLGLQDAGCDLSQSKNKIGLFVSASDNNNWLAHAMMNPSNNVSPYYASQLSNKNFASTLISYNLNLKGPSYYLNTACSSSLVTVHLACRNLMMRECSVAVAGAASLSSVRSMGYHTQEGMIYSKDGHCKTFDIDASGTIAGEGAGVVVLKRMEDAIKDGDCIYATIRASAVNNDGKRKVGFTAPSVNGQYECIKTAQNIAKVSPESISYIEAHGTATKLGDPIEIEALNKAFANNTAHSCAIGSVKSNMGHLDTAAGIAGLIKTVLTVKHKVIPPSLHFTEPNPEINFKDGPFYVNSELQNWKSKNGELFCAGVSSFGIGGTNAHIIVEEAPQTVSVSPTRPFQLMVYSAKTITSLTRYNDVLKEFLQNENEVNLADLAYTQKTALEAFRIRNFCVCQDKNDAIEKLEANVNSKPFVSKLNRDIVFMFSGQGSQYFKMAEDLYLQEPEFKSLMDEGFQILNEIINVDFAEIIGYKTSKENNENLINETRFTQPLLFLVEYALTQLLMKWGLTPKFMIGHSLGEYVAACISGVFSLSDALAIIVKRAELMGQVEEGDMLGIAATMEQLKPLLNERISVAAINANNRVVVSGTKNNIAEFAEQLKEEKLPFTKLKTSHAFHSEMMDGILEAFAAELDKVSFSEPRLPYVSNLTGVEILPTEAMSPSYWVKHLRQTVNFSKGVEFLLEKKDVAFVEVGPGKNLLNFCKTNDNYSANVLIETIRHPKEKVNDNLKLTTALGKLWSCGVDLNWKEYYVNEKRSKTSIPLYSFDNYKLDSIVNPFDQLKGLAPIENGQAKSFADWFYIPNWKKSLKIKNGNTPSKNQNFVIFSNENVLVSSMIKGLRLEGSEVVEVVQRDGFEELDQNKYAIDPENEGNFKTLFNCIEDRKTTFQQIVFAWNFERKNPEKVYNAFYIILNLCKRLSTYQSGIKKKITFLSHLNQSVITGEKANVPLITSTIAAQVCSQENPNIFTCNIDLGEEEDLDILPQISNELKYNSSVSNVAYRNRNRWIGFYDKVDLAVEQKNEYLKPDKMYVITGGLGAIGGVLAKHLIEKYNAKIILLGRSHIPNKENWSAYLNSAGKNENVVSKIKKMQGLGNDVFYFDVDVSDSKALQKVIERIEKEHGRISGVIHTAGNIDKNTFKPLVNIDKNIISEQFKPKVQGTLNIYSIFKEKDLDFVWITSSLSSVLGGLTYGAYAAANKFVDAFVSSKSDELKNWFCVNLDGVNESSINNDNLIKVFEQSFNIGELPQVIVSLRDLNQQIQKQNKADKGIEENIELDSIKLERSILNNAYSPPTNEIEEKVCEIWESFFGYERIGINDDFFELGGDSLKAMTLLQNVQQIFNIEVSLQDFYEKSSVKKLSDEINLARGLINIQKKSTRKNVIKI